ncbi:MAG: hypothetical protein Q4C57_06670 [Bacillota bacterium]|nr:hypothetical protein [Bacillota bacterium]
MKEEKRGESPAEGKLAVKREKQEVKNRKQKIGKARYGYDHFAVTKTYKGLLNS